MVYRKRRERNEFSRSADECFVQKKNIGPQMNKTNFLAFDDSNKPAIRVHSRPVAAVLLIDRGGLNLDREIRGHIG